MGIMDEVFYLSRLLKNVPELSFRALSEAKRKNRCIKDSEKKSRSRDLNKCGESSLSLRMTGWKGLLPVGMRDDGKGAWYAPMAEIAY
jgi:hypothetical protein